MHDFRKEDREKPSTMKQFGMTPSEKAMAETQMNVAEEILPKIGKYAHPANINNGATTSSDQNGYEEVKLLDYNDYENVGADEMMVAYIKQDDVTKDKHEQEKEEEQSDTLDLEVTAIDDEHIYEEVQETEARSNKKEERKPAEGQDTSQGDEGVLAEVEVKP